MALKFNIICAALFRIFYTTNNAYNVKYVNSKPQTNINNENKNTQKAHTFVLATFSL